MIRYGIGLAPLRQGNHRQVAAIIRFATVARSAIAKQVLVGIGVGAQGARRRDTGGCQPREHVSGKIELQVTNADARREEQRLETQARVPEEFKHWYDGDRP